MASQIRSSEMKRALFALGQFVPVGRAVRCYSACFQMITKPGEIARLYRDLSLFPSLNRADVGPVVTSQYGGKYTNIYTGNSYSTVFRCICICVLAFNTVSLSSFAAEWTQSDLERNEKVKFCRQYIVFHDDKSVVFSGASGNCTEIKGEYVKILIV